MPTSETDLIRLKAAGMTSEQIAAEILRCRQGIEVTATPATRRRFERRIRIMEDELLRRSSDRTPNTAPHPVL